MRVLVCNPLAIWDHHFGTSLELVQRYLNDSSDVTFLTCDAALPLCEANRTHDLATCVRCIATRKAGLSLLENKCSVKTKPLISLTPTQRAAIRALPTAFADLKELKSYWVDNLDLGWAALSTLIDILRDPSPEMRTESNRRILRTLMQTALAVYYSTRNYLQAEQFDVAYVFNGRLATVRGAVRACQAEGVTCYTHEDGHDPHHFALYRDTLPHDIAFNVQQMLRNWDAAAADERERLGAQFYEDRALDRQRSGSFIGRQDSRMLPADWSQRRKNIAVFTSSEDEFASIGDEWSNPLYESQLAGLRQIIGDMCGHPDYHLYVRIHPNLIGVKAPYVQEMLALKAANLTVIAPESPVSTYTLMKQADRVLTFGSTVGIEATYWRKPSILAGQSLYRSLGATHNPQSHTELIQLLTQDSLAPCPVEGALVYGFYMQTWGEPYRYYENPHHVGEDKLLNGRRLNVSSMYSLIADRILSSHPLLRKLAQPISRTLVYAPLR